MNYEYGFIVLIRYNLPYKNKKCRTWNQSCLWKVKDITYFNV